MYKTLLKAQEKAHKEETKGQGLGSTK